MTLLTRTSKYSLQCKLFSSSWCLCTIPGSSSNYETIDFYLESLSWVTFIHKTVNQESNIEKTRSSQNPQFTIKSKHLQRGSVQFYRYFQDMDLFICQLCTKPYRSPVVICKCGHSCQFVHIQKFSMRNEVFTFTIIYTFQKINHPYFFPYKYILIVILLNVYVLFSYRVF